MLKAVFNKKSKEIKIKFDTNVPVMTLSHYLL
jgi:hypothetical protein